MYSVLPYFRLTVIDLQTSKTGETIQAKKSRWSEAETKILKRLCAFVGYFPYQMRQTYAFIQPIPIQSSFFHSSVRAERWKPKPRRKLQANRLVSRPIFYCCAATATVQRLREEIERIAGDQRGIFGLEDDEREFLDKIIQTVESETPITEPTAHNAKAAAGTWRLLYTNLEILGQKRIRLAISMPDKPGLVQLGDFLQTVDPSTMESKSIVEFKVMAFGTGTFTILSDYEVESAKRVKVIGKTAELEPEKLEALLGENKKLLTQIFNPTGHLDITYLDENFRVGRDGKGRVFVLERVDVKSQCA